MKPQLQLTNAGRSAFTSLTALSIDHFLCGSSFDTNNESIETASPFQFNIHFQKVYVKGEQYEKNGVTVTEGYDHIKIIGYLSSSDITFDDTGEYTVREIGLMGTLNNQSVCLAYGYNEEGITLYENTNDRYIIKLDIICEQTPNIVINNSIGYVAYNDFLDHIDKRIDGNTPVHGLNIINDRIYINGNPLTIDVEGVSNAKMDNIIGIDEEVEVLPATTDYAVGNIVALKDTGTMYKNTEVLDNNNLVNQWIPTGSISSQLGLLNSYGSMIPLRTNNTRYTVGDVVKLSICKPFQYLECIVNGTSGDGSAFNSVNTIGNNEVATAYVDGTCIWFVCDMRDGRLPGEFLFFPFDQNIKSYFFLWQDYTLFDTSNNTNSWENYHYIRILRKVTEQALFQYAHSSLFSFDVSASTNTASVNPVLLHGAGVAIIDQWCRDPLTFINTKTINDNNLMFYRLNQVASVSYTNEQYLNTAQTLINDILKNNSGKIFIKVKTLDGKYIKLQSQWIKNTQFESEGLPNITGTFKLLEPGAKSWGRFTDETGAFFSDTVATTKGAGDSSVNGNSRLQLNASRSSSIYGSSSKVTPENISLAVHLKY